MRINTTELLWLALTLGVFLVLLTLTLGVFLVVLTLTLWSGK